MPARKDLIVDSSILPQFDSLERILEAVTVLSQGVLSEETIDLSSRHVNYVKQAARVLGLISSDGEVTAAGRRALGLSGERRNRLLRQQFEQSVCGKAWMAWAKVSVLDELDPLSAEPFLEACSDLPAGMVKRRGRTLRRWCTELRSDDGTSNAAVRPDRKPAQGRVPGTRRARSVGRTA